MPAKSPKKKKSFLHKFSRVFVKKKRSKSDDDNYSSDESSSPSEGDTTGSLSASSKSRTPPVALPRNKRNARVAADVQNATVVKPNRKERAEKREIAPNKPSSTSTTFDIDSGKDLCTLQPKEPHSEITEGVENTTTLTSQIPGGDKNLQAKELFMKDTKNSIETETSENSSAEAVTLKEVDPVLVMDQLNSSVSKITSKFMTRMMKDENFDSDSDIDDATDDETDTSDENTDFIDAERDELDYGELYFTKGKYMSYFFLQMERQSYDPDVYTIVRYYGNEHLRLSQRGKKGKEKL